MGGGRLHAGNQWGREGKRISEDLLSLMKVGFGDKQLHKAFGAITAKANAIRGTAGASVHGLFAGLILPGKSRAPLDPPGKPGQALTPVEQPQQCIIDPVDRFACPGQCQQA